MESIKDIIPGVLRGLKTNNPVNETPEELLKKALSKKEQGQVSFRYLRKGILGLAVDSSARLYQLNLEKGRLLAKIAKKITTVKDIRFYIGDKQ